MTMSDEQHQNDDLIRLLSQPSEHLSVEELENIRQRVKERDDKLRAQLAKAKQDEARVKKQRPKLHQLAFEALLVEGEKRKREHNDTQLLDALEWARGVAQQQLDADTEARSQRARDAHAARSDEANSTS